MPNDARAYFVENKIVWNIQEMLLAMKLSFYVMFRIQLNTDEHV